MIYLLKIPKCMNPGDFYNECFLLWSKKPFLTSFQFLKRCPKNCFTFLILHLNDCLENEYVFRAQKHQNWLNKTESKFSPRSRAKKTIKILQNYSNSFMLSSILFNFHYNMHEINLFLSMSENVLGARSIYF